MSFIYKILHLPLDTTDSSESTTTWTVLFFAYYQDSLYSSI